MAESEFNIIEHYFKRSRPQRDDVSLAIGDDAALLDVPHGKQLVVCVDTLVAGVHFPHDTPAHAIGYKAMAVNLSDIAAMGAEPAWATLALTVPDSDAHWLESFSNGLFELAERYRVALVGGDTTRGPLTITVQLHGLVEHGAALRRDGAQPGDLIYVTGTLGDAGLALRLLLDSHLPANSSGDALLARLNYPTPRIAAGRALSAVATAAIDISDGLVADLGHVLQASKVGATLRVDQIPCSGAFVEIIGKKSDNSDVERYQLALTAGDDYELCFTVPAARQHLLPPLFAALDCDCTLIGTIEARSGLRCVTADGAAVEIKQPGYNHFQ
ncbi:MAG: thiamine-phosphate kinase [Gammaproteobacteria bacterium]|nr:thiamine-phosphate kinase [Gammaproteobacteria bacterium]